MHSPSQVRTFGGSLVGPHKLEGMFGGRDTVKFSLGGVLGWLGLG